MVSTKELSDALRQLFNSTDDLAFEIVTGEVFMAYPALNIYVVIPRGGSPTGDLIVATTGHGGSSRKSGTKGGDAYMTGTTVLLARLRQAVQVKLNMAGKVSLAYVIGRAPEHAPDPEGYPPNNVTGEDLDFFRQQLTDAFTSSQQLPAASQDVSYGVPTDLLAGDYVKIGALLNTTYSWAPYTPR